MPIFHQYDYLFSIGLVFATLDAFNIGANDVASSFATSVSSGSLTLRQACIVAAICEFLGAVLVGARVAGTIKNNIISLDAFKDNAGVQLLGFTCAITASASWLMLATHQSWPISTTYSIVAAVIGVGIAAAGADTVQWGWHDSKGVATIFAGFIIAPGIAAAFAAIVFLITKYCILARTNTIRWALVASPVYFFVVSIILTTSILYKGAPNLNIDALSPSDLAAAILGTSTVVALLSALFWLPYVYSQVVKKDHTIRWYHFFFGPLLWYRPAPKDAGKGKEYVPDYRVRKDNSNPVHIPEPESIEVDSEHDIEKGVDIDAPPSPYPPSVDLPDEAEPPELRDPEIEGPWILPSNLWIILRHRIVPFVVKVFTHGTSVDVVGLQHMASKKQAERVRRMHILAHQYPNETEHLYSFLQVMTACTASFGHGANDVSNAIGPFAAIYEIWSTSAPVAGDSAVPVWMLAMGGAWIVVGLATYGYNTMRVLGNRLTLMSPTRGFSMELGSAITVILASQFGIPVSSVMCIVGATLGVALCNGDLRAFNWPGLAWIVLGWLLTVPVVGLGAGCLMGIILNAPHF